MTRKREAIPSSSEVLQTLGWIRKQGFRPVPLHPRSKAAISNDYVRTDYRPPGDEFWRSGDYGVGVATGPQHGGPVDGDLDCDEAVFFAEIFMPPTTAIFGRKQKPRSHRLYRVDTPTFEKVSFVDPVTRETILELRGDNGHQTVFPGSMHQDTGELIQWSEVPFPEVPTISSSVLIQAARRVAAATLVSRYAWSDGYHNEPCKHLSGIFFHLGWSLEEAERFVTALMNWSGDTDKSRIPTIRATYRRGEAGKKVSGAGVLRRDLKNDPVVDKILEWAGSPTASMMQEFNDRYAVVSVGGKFRIADVDVPAGDPPDFYRRDDFLAFTEADRVEVEGKMIPRARVWLANPRRRTYRSVDFMPGQDADGDVLNLWTGWAKLPAESSSGCKAWLELLREVICENKEESIWCEHWFANILREPLDKTQTALALVGEEGVGKSLLLGYFGCILGRSGYTVITQEDHLYGRFNQHLGTCLLLHSEEALYGGERRHAGIIRSLITDRTRMYEPKGIDARQVNNYLRLALTSNKHHVAPVQAGDRRYTVIDMYRGSRRASSKLVSRVLAEMKNGGPEALHRYLLDMRYDPALARSNLRGETLAELKLLNLDPVQDWWLNALRRGTVLPDYLAWATSPERENWPAVVSSPALYAAAVTEMKERGVRSIPTDVALALQLNRLVGVKLRREQRAFVNPMADGVPPAARALGDRMSAVLNMPSLDDCRAAFERHVGQELEWPGAGDGKKVKELY